MKRLWQSWFPRVFCGGCLLVLAAGMTLFVSGCGGQGGPDRQRVSGKITFGGKPVPGGQIIFEPDGIVGNRGPQGSAQIVDGHYETGKSGPVGGAQVARITGLDSKPGGAVAPRPLFNPYEFKVDLGKGTTTKDFDVPAEAAKGLRVSNEPPP